MKTEPIQATIVEAEAERLQFLPAMFGEKYFVRAQNLLFAYAVKLVERDLKTGLWVYKRLSNGGAYAAPVQSERVTVTVFESQFEREMSSDAAGIVICMFVLGHLSARADAAGDDDGTELLVTQYERLREYARQHAEREVILAAID
ncbi:antirestriction protein [Burkholderia sp. Ac-20365]|uniref:antirestriction protein n=1 Tax=Burkholderia sp. Ac-20365 TaxID=2703897 RepID=UPI00197B87C2|nr:antirestriction protein [Burkholderia sp. Ac-20365]MBN3760899.1 antirestriction protein [Burkholderia sp. Ac-20365]